MKSNFIKALALTMLVIGIAVIEPQSVQAQTTGTSVLSVNVAAAGTLSVNTATTTFTNTGGFTSFAGTTNLQFSVRTTKTTGSGTLTVSFASDWSPVGGPSITASPVQLSFTCGALGGGPPLTGGTACSGTQNVNALTTPVNVVTFGAGAKINNGTEAQSWTLLNDPNYDVNTYTATATYTLSVS